MDVVVAVQYKIINEVVRPSGSSKEGLQPSYGSINPTLDQSLVSEGRSSSNSTLNPTLDEQRLQDLKSVVASLPRLSRGNLTFHDVGFGNSDLLHAPGDHEGAFDAGLEYEDSPPSARYRNVIDQRKCM